MTEAQINTLTNRHHAADDRYLARMDNAERFIGELCRDGKPVFYAMVGQYREGTYAEITEYLIRNRYV
jgi:hypothetical protein